MTKIDRDGTRADDAAASGQADDDLGFESILSRIHAGEAAIQASVPDTPSSDAREAAPNTMVEDSGPEASETPPVHERRRGDRRGQTRRADDRAARRTDPLPFGDARDIEPFDSVCAIDAEVADILASHLQLADRRGHAVLDSERRHIYYDARYLEMNGVRPEDMSPGIKVDALLVHGAQGGLAAGGDGSVPEVGMRWAQDLSDMMEAMSRCAERRQLARDSVCIPTPDGRIVKAHVIYTEDAHIVLTLEDVTRERAHKTLLDIAFATGDAGWWSYEVATNTFEFSDSVLGRLSDDEVSTVRTSGLWAIVERDDIPGIMAKWSWALNNPEEDRLDITYRVTTERDGTMWQRSIMNIQRDEEGRPTRVTAFVRDNTRDVAREAELVEAREAASAKTEFLARMSHEIRTPLNAVIGLCDLLEEDYALEPEVAEIVASIDAAADGLHHLLSQTLDHAKLVADKVEIETAPTDARALLTEVERLWTPQARVKGLALVSQSSDDVPDTLPLDEFRVRQCLNNLVSNAVKFTETGGVRLEADLQGHGEGCVLRMRVADTGIGMDEAALASVFAPFEQAERSTTRRFGGTGLGMTITDQLARLMGGRVEVVSAPGRGTVFTLTLPAAHARPEPVPEPEPVSDPAAEAAPAEATPAEGAEPSPYEPFRGLRVLCVEDAEMNRSLIKRLLDGIVGTLSFAEDGREALAELDMAQYDVILMDIHMPVMDGIETTIAIRNSEKAYANVVIIALTADPDYQHTRICRNLGMDDAISKPVRRREILEAFERSFDLVSEVYGQPVEIPGGARGRARKRVDGPTGKQGDAHGEDRREGRAA